MLLPVLSQSTQIAKHLMAFSTLVGFISGMDGHVFVSASTKGKQFETVVATEFVGQISVTY